MENYTPMTVCPHCGARIREDALVCDYCDCSLPHPDIKQDTADADPYASDGNFQGVNRNGYNNRYSGTDAYSTPRYNEDPRVTYVNYGSSTDGGFNQNVNTAVPQGKRINKWLAFILCLCFGCLGLHKFYEGKILMGIIYIFTGGLGGIGWFINCIVILTKPDPYYV